ncbi:MAG: hypothetical protein FJW99_03075 [Actinobacteria bacterium]|nr:hypothetical protein [Actinomycetota bacterium]
MNKTLIVIPLIAGAIAAAGCGGSSDQASQAADARGDIEKNLASATTGADANRQAAATPDIGEGALKIVNRVNRTVTLRVTEVDNYDWAGGDRPDHAPPQGFQGAQIVQNQFALARTLTPNTNAKSWPFRIEVYGPSPTKPIASIRLALCSTVYSKTPYKGKNSVGYLVQPERSDGENTCHTGSVTNHDMGAYQGWAYGIRFSVPKGMVKVGDTWRPDAPSIMEITQTIPPAQ